MIGWFSREYGNFSTNSSSKIILTEWGFAKFRIVNLSFVIIFYLVLLQFSMDIFRPVFFQSEFDFSLTFTP